MSEPVLSHTATAGEISALIKGVQGRAKLGLANPDRLALRVRAILTLATEMARAGGMRLHQLCPSLQAWEEDENSKAGIVTIVQVTTVLEVVSIEVRRGAVPIGVGNGALSLRLSESRRTRR